MSPDLSGHSAAFAELGRIKLSENDLDAVLARVAQLARTHLHGADEVSVTLIRGSRARTAAFTGPLARALDDWQYERGHGPCLEAAAAKTLLSVSHIAEDRRWPDWSAEAAAAGAGSSLSIGLPIDGDRVSGALNCYAMRPDAFDKEAVDLARAFAGYAAVALANAHLYGATAGLAQHMEKAMQTRAVIEQAKGIIMGERRCSADEAFAILTRVSQDSNRKLHDVAAALVARAQTRR